MLKKALITAVSCAVMVCFMALPTLYAVDAPGDMVISYPDGYTPAKGKVKKLVPFSHKGHAAMKCEQCHHKGGDNYKCAGEGCHNDWANKKGDHSAYMAYHNSKSMHSCLGCHKAKKKAKEATGPTACAKCHTK